MSLSKDDAITKIHNCAVLYHKNLLGRNVLFAVSNGSEPGFFEAVFLAKNYLHFTGVKTKRRANDFFNAALENKLSKNDIEIMPDGTTTLKLDALPTLMNICTTARMAGDYNNSKSLLVTDKLAGTQTAAMGFIKGNGYFIPNTVLKEDLRNLTEIPRQRIIAMFVKNIKDKKYATLTYIAKGFTVDDEMIVHNAGEKVDFSNLTASFQIARKIT